MRYTVVWLPAAKAQLARLWMQASDRQAVSDSADRIDGALKDDPDKKGSLLGPLYVFHGDTLSVLYSVDDGDRMVRVMQVRRN